MCAQCIRGWSIMLTKFILIWNLFEVLPCEYTCQKALGPCQKVFLVSANASVGVSGWYSFVKIFIFKSGIRVAVSGLPFLHIHFFFESRRKIFGVLIRSVKSSFLWHFVVFRILAHARSCSKMNGKCYDTVAWS